LSVMLRTTMATAFSNVFMCNSSCKDPHPTGSAGNPDGLEVETLLFLGDRLNL